MATIRLKIQGNLGTISLRTLVASIDNELSILSDLDSAISGKRKPTLDWVVTGLEAGSVCVLADSVSKHEDIDIGPQVVENCVRGLRQIEIEGTTPPYFLESTMNHTTKLLGLIGKGGTTGLEIYTPEVGPVELSAKSSVNAANLLPSRYSSIGSVEGRVEMISIHGESRFVVYLSINRKAVTCKIPPDRIQEAKQFLGKRVNVNGTIHYNYVGEPVRLDVEDIRVMKEDSELPTSKQLNGYDPEFTGSSSTSEYLEDIRG